MGDEDE
jgi:NIMA (never in mitosis gene a)-related kinase